MNAYDDNPEKAQHVTIKLKPLHLAILALSLAGGLLLGLIFANNSSDKPRLTSMRMETLTLMYSDARDEILRLQKEVDRLRGQLQSYEEAATANTGLAEQMRKELQQLRALSGLLPVKGPGVLITLTDAPRSPQGNTEDEFAGPEEAMLVHDQDLLQLTNELKAAGAEAISINGQRLGPLTEIRCAGQVIRVNGNPVASPFKVKAIGDPQALYNALTMRGGFKERLEQYGPEVTIKRETELTLPALSSTPVFKFATPVVPAEEGNSKNPVGGAQ